MNKFKMEIIFNNKKYDYRDYQKFTNRFESVFNNTSRLALIMERTPDLIFAIYKCMENKITYIPIDPTYPLERIQYMIDQTMPDNIMTNLNKGIKFNPSKSHYTCENNIAYIIYTSGSTGMPKGVEITRDGLMHFMNGISEIIDFSEGKRIACFATVAFDIFFMESIMALYKGLTVVLANDDEKRNPRLMAEFIVSNNIDMIEMTPSNVQLLLKYDNNLNCLKNVKEIMIGAEPFPYKLLKILQEKTSAKIYNLYGLTETTIWSTISDLTKKDKIDIGKPIKGTQIYIIDEELNILDDGKTGEICIGGKGLAKGYLEQDNLTEKQFIYFPQKSYSRIYKTGDLGRWLPDGNLEYHGRLDNQIKLRGHRIELEEIESNINKYQDIIQSIVKVVELNETDKIFEAIYVASKEIDQNDLRTFLEKKIPDYMVPSKFTQIEAFSYLPNGKIDRKNINNSNCNSVKIYDAHNDSQLTEIQKKAFNIIKSNLDESIFPDISIDANLKSTGINSITFIKIVVSLETEFKFEFDDEMLLLTSFSTLRSLTEYTELKVSQLLCETHGI